MTSADGLAVALRWGCGVAAAAGLLASSGTTSTSSAGPSGASPQTTRVAERPFTFTARNLSRKVRRRITGVSWHRGCPVGLGRLRYLRIAYHGFGGRVRTGEMVANASAVRPL